MAGTTVKSRSTLGLAGSVSREAVINLNKLVDDVELVRAATRQLVRIPVEDLGAGADITERAHYIAPRASTVIDSVRAVFSAATAGVDGSNTLVIKLRNITEGADIATVTKTATTSANAVESLTLVAAAADIAASDVLGIVVTQGAASDAGTFTLQFEIQPQTVDAAGDMTAAKIGDDSGTAYSA
jgi:hypothetical protein